MNAADMKNPEQARHTRKITSLIEHLVERSVKNGAVYFEHSVVNGQITPIVSRYSTIAALLTPYVLYVANNYIQRVWGEEFSCVTFEKQVNKFIPNEYSLVANLNDTFYSNLTLFLPFVVIAFEDRFISSKKNKVVVTNLLNFLS